MQVIFVVNIYNDGKRTYKAVSLTVLRGLSVTLDGEVTVDAGAVSTTASSPVGTSVNCNRRNVNVTKTGSISEVRLIETFIVNYIL